MKNKHLMTALAATTMLCVASTSDAATFFKSTVAPTVNNADIANLDQSTRFFEWGTSALWGDRPARGQTFTTGASAVELNALTFQAGGNQSGNGTWFIRVGSLSGTDFTEIAAESVTTTTDVLDFDYITFTLDTAVELDANTTYAIDLGRSGSGFGIYNNTTYAGGTRYSSGGGGTGGATISEHTNDRVFHLDMVNVVPEPSSLALLAMGGLMIARRRKG